MINITYGFEHPNPERFMPNDIGVAIKSASEYVQDKKRLTVLSDDPLSAESIFSNQAVLNKIGYVDGEIEVIEYNIVEHNCESGFFDEKGEFISHVFPWQSIITFRINK